MTKALIVQSDARGYASLLKVVELFSDEQVGKDAAMSLGIIADESDGVLSKDNFAVIRVILRGSLLHAMHEADSSSSHLVPLQTALLFHDPDATRFGIPILKRSASAVFRVALSCI